RTTHVAGDPKEPGPLRLRRVEPGVIAGGLHECLLQQLVRLAGAKPATEVCQQRRTMLVIQRLESPHGPSGRTDRPCSTLRDGYKKFKENPRRLVEALRGGTYRPDRTEPSPRRP